MVPEQRLKNHKITNFEKKFKLLDKRGFEPTEKQQSTELPAPRSTPTPKLSVASMVWNISIHQLDYLYGYVPSQLLHSCSSAEHEKLEEVLDFIATTENISVIIILLILNSTHGSY